MARLDQVGVAGRRRRATGSRRRRSSARPGGRVRRQRGVVHVGGSGGVAWPPRPSWRGVPAAGGGVAVDGHRRQAPGGGGFQGQVGDVEVEQLAGDSLAVVARRCWWRRLFGSASGGALSMVLAELASSAAARAESITLSALLVGGIRPGWRC